MRNSICRSFRHLKTKHRWISWLAVNYLTIGKWSKDWSSNKNSVAQFVDQSVNRRCFNQTYGQSIRQSFNRQSAGTMAPSKIGRSVGRTIHNGTSTRWTIGRQFFQQSFGHQLASKTIDFHNIAKFVGSSIYHQWIGRSVYQWNIDCRLFDRPINI